MKKLLIKRFLLMLQFLTAIPVPVRIDAGEKDLGEGLIFAVPVGLVIGGILAGFYYLFSMFLPPLSCAVLLSIVYIISTGGLHLDGLGDTFDGVMSHRSRKRMLEIMKDSRMGSNAVLVLICLLLLNTVFYYEADTFRISMLLLMPVAGRMGIVIGAGVSEYARVEGGLGKAFVDYCGLKQIVLGLIMYGVIFALIGNVQSTVAGIVSCLFSFSAAKYFGSRLRGVTGDILGALCEMTQTFFMFAMFAAGSLGL